MVLADRPRGVINYVQMYIYHVVLGSEAVKYRREERLHIENS